MKPVAEKKRELSLGRRKMLKIRNISKSLCVRQLEELGVVSHLTQSIVALGKR
jgi:hypothetical protein